MCFGRFDRGWLSRFAPALLERENNTLVGLFCVFLHRRGGHVDGVATGIQIILRDPVKRRRQGRDMAHAFFAQYLLDAFDRQPVFMQQALDTAKQQHIVGAIISPPACAFDRFDLRELAFPETQDMRLNFKPFCNFGDGSECVRRLGH